MNKDNLVTIKKIEDYLKQSVIYDWENYRPTPIEDNTLEVGESVTGYLLCPLEVGYIVNLQTVDPTHRYIIGLFNTYPVADIIDDGFVTSTARYEIKYLNQNSNYII